MLKSAGADVWRVGFNAGDRAFWFSKSSFIPYTDSPDAWPERLEEIISEKGVTDLVLYGDTRPVHALAIERAKARGLTVHVFEEGYIRPYWVTYERDGSNGHSVLMDLTVDEMSDALNEIEHDPIETPALWGDMKEHIFYGALYHWFVIFRNSSFKNYRGHRELPVHREFLLYFKRLMMMPTHWISRALRTRAILGAGHPFHIALLQIEHDTSFLFHSPYATMTEFMADVIDGFAKGAPKHHHLVFKAHPLENDRRNLKHEIKRLAGEHGLQDRVHFVRGGKLQKLLSNARSAVTVNSTAGQQALWLGLPIRTLGSAVYNKPEFVSTQPLEEFFRAPTRPNAQAYSTYRHFLLETSQVAGGFYSHRGRKRLLRLVVDLMLAKESPDTALLSGTASPRPPLRLVK
ncbi:capsular biosynthesis protein [Celeribacter sp. ASW11-22]|nr:capsular biosynthesis protein [Celeribacter litoreus]MCA0043023.1 capsular biosynthesis protein [Celeribacter litoreus]